MKKKFILPILMLGALKTFPEPAIAETDPSLPPQEILDQLKPKVEVDLSGIEVKSIIYSEDPQRRMANVNGKMLKVGSSFEEFTIHSINKENISLMDPNKNIHKINKKGP